jgi:hypothetical protein
MNLTRIAALMAAAGSIGSMLAGCGGGESAVPAPPPPPTVNVATKVVDGPIANASVCFDRNDNGACDADEPSGKTDADGAATLTVLESEAGQHALIAIVGTDAVDKEHGPVTQGYILTTTADKPALLSPLTTLVRANVDASGMSTADAEKALQDQLGIDSSLFTDFSQGSDPQGATLAQLARLVALIKGQAFESLKSAVGENDSAGNTMSRADIERAIELTLLQQAQDLMAALGTDAVRNAATSAAREAAIQAAATAVIQANADFDPAQAIPAMKQARQGEAEAPAAATGPGASLRWFSYSDAGNWYFRLYESTAQQNVPDADGNRHFSEKRKRAVNGNVEVWGSVTSFTRTDLYWTGSAWFACPTDYEHPGTPWDSQGTSTSNYCSAWKSTSRRHSRDIAGAKLSDVVREIRAYPLHDNEGSFPSWGPDPDDPKLANLTFPSGSKLWFYSGADISNPAAYRPGDLLLAFNADVANGVTAECNKVTTSNFANFQVQPATLEAMVAASGAKPCVYTPNADTGPRNEWWSNSTVSIGTIAGPASSNPYYQSNRSVRIGFGSGQSVTFYDCAIRTQGGSVRNCDAIGSGTYSIETLGDARVMRFANVPAAAAPLTYSRLFVERGGKVYYGYRTKLRVSNQVRPNMEATDALFAPLGITR